MSFVKSGNIITQSGTDTNLSGLASISGVTTSTENTPNSTKTIYDIGNSQLKVTGNLTYKPMNEVIKCSYSTAPMIVVESGGNLTLGEDVHRHTFFQALRANTTSAFTFLQVKSGGFITIHNTIFEGNGTLEFDDGCTYTFNHLVLAPLGQDSGDDYKLIIRDESGSSSGIVIEGGSLQIEKDSSTVNAIVLQNSEDGIIGKDSSTSATRSLICNYVEFDGHNTRDVSLRSGSSGDVFSATINNTNRGSSTTILGASSSASNRNCGYVRINSSFRVEVKDKNGNDYQAYVVYVPDTDNGSRKNLNGQNDTADKRNVFFFENQAVSSFIDITTAIVNVARNASNTGGTQNVAPYTVDLRGKTNVLGDDLFDIYVIDYRGLPLTLNDVSLKGTTPQTLKAVADVDPSISQTSFNAVSGYTLVSNLDQLYDVLKYILVSNTNVMDRVVDPDKLLATARDGQILDLGSVNLSLISGTGFFDINIGSRTVSIYTNGISAGTKFKSLITSGTISGKNLLNVPYRDSTRQLKVTIDGYEAVDTLSYRVGQTGNWTVVSQPSDVNLNYEYFYSTSTNTVHFRRELPDGTEIIKPFLESTPSDSTINLAVAFIATTEHTELKDLLEANSQKLDDSLANEEVILNEVTLTKDKL